MHAKFGSIACCINKSSLHLYLIFLIVLKVFIFQNANQLNLILTNASSDQFYVYL